MKEFFKKHKKLWIILGIIIVLIAALVIFVRVKLNQAAQAIAAASTQETDFAERRELVTSVAANGTIVAADDKNVSVNLSGVDILTMDVEVGDEVKEGDLICTLDSSDLEQKLADAEKSLEADKATANINVSSAERMLAEAEVSRDLDAEAADINIANAWTDYQNALNDVAEAENDYNEALSDYNSVNGNITTLDEAELWFAHTKDDMSAYMTAENITFRSGTINMQSIAIGVEEWCYLTSDHFMTFDEKPLEGDVKERMDSYLTYLKRCHYYYISYVDGGTTSSSGSAESVLETYDNTQEKAKQTYDSAVTTAESKLRTYEEMVRKKTTTENSSNSSVASQEESVQKSKISASTAGLNTQETIDNYKDQIEDCTVTAPMAGTITSVNFDAGDTYNGNAIVTIEDESSYQVSAEIEEYDIGQIKVGQDVVIKTNGTGDEELEGRVAEIAEHASSGTASSSSTTTYNVKIDLLTDNDAIKLDMTAKVSIIIDKVEDALTVPYDAVQTDNEGNDFVEVVTSSDDSEQTASTDDTQAAPSDGTQAAPSGDQTAAPDGSQPQGGAPGQPSGSKGILSIFSSGNKDTAAQLQTKRVYITRGAESDYYIQVISDELKEGDEVVVITEESNSLQNMMMQMGAMGGF